MSFNSFIEYNIADIESSSATTADRFDTQVVRQEHYLCQTAIHSIHFVRRFRQLIVGDVPNTSIAEQFGQRPELRRPITDQ